MDQYEILQQQIDWNDRRISSLEEKATLPDSWERGGQMVLEYIKDDKEFKAHVITRLSDMQVTIAKLSEQSSLKRQLVVAAGASIPGAVALTFLIFRALTGV